MKKKCAIIILISLLLLLCVAALFWIFANHNWVNYFLLHRSTSPDVTIGSDGWLFFNDTLADYRKDNLYSQEDLERIRQDVLYTQNYLAEQGIEFILFISPNKATIYGEHMPRNIETQSGPSRTEQLVDYLQSTTDVTILHPKDALLQAKNDHPNLPLYLHNDTHWNYLGGYFATLPLLETLNVPTVPFENITCTAVSEPIFFWSGYDLADMLELSHVLTDDTNYQLEGYSSANVTYDGDATRDRDTFYGCVRSQSDAPDDREIFVVRDSFGQSMTPYLAAAFQNVTFQHHRTLSRSQIEAEQPDVFIYQIVERSALHTIHCGLWNP